MTLTDVQLLHQCRDTLKAAIQAATAANAHLTALYHAPLAAAVAALRQDWDTRPGVPDAKAAVTQSLLALDNADQELRLALLYNYSTTGETAPLPGCTVLTVQVYAVKDDAAALAWAAREAPGLVTGAPSYLPWIIAWHTQVNPLPFVTATEHVEATIARELL